MPLTELDSDQESVWLKRLANKTTHFVARWYQLPVGGHLKVSENGNDLLNSLKGLTIYLENSLTNSKTLIKATNPLSSRFR